MMGRNRGARFGNQNAHKHGFYSAAFRQNELRILADSNPTDLADEISLVRTGLMRTHGIGSLPAGLMSPDASEPDAAAGQDRSDDEPV